MNEKHNDLFTINDITLQVSPTKIGIHRAALNRQWKTLRTRQSMKAKSGHSDLSITAEVVFVGIEEVNTKLRVLLAQFKLTPFCYVENEHIRNTVLGPNSEGVNMGLALQNISISSIPDSPDTIIANFSFLWFNYKPFTPNFYFKNNPFDPNPQARPGEAFKMFYTPQLDRHPSIRSADNQLLELSYPEFTIDAGQVNGKTPDKFKLSEVLDEEQKSSINDLISEFTNTMNFIHTAQDTNNNLPIVDKSKLVKFEQAIARWNVVQSGTEAANSSAVELLNLTSVIADITSSYQDTGKKRKTDQASLRQLVRLKDEVNRRSEEAISKPGGWLPFFKDPIVDETTKPINSKETLTKVDQLYYRIKQLFLNTGAGEDMTVTDLNAGFSHHLAVLPVLSYQYPTCQYLGTSDIQVQLSMKVTSDKALRVLTDMYNGLSSNSITGKFIPAQYVNLLIRNPLVNLLGGKEMTMDDMVVNTIPGSPGTYDVQLLFSDAGVKSGDLEELGVDKTTENNVRDAVWKGVLSNLIVQSAKAIARPGGDVSFGGRTIDVKFSIDSSIDQASQEFLNNLLNRGLLSNGVFATTEENVSRMSRFLKDLYDQAISDGLTSDQFLTALSIGKDETLAPDDLSRILYEIAEKEKGTERVSALISGNNFQNSRASLGDLASAERASQQTEKQKTSQLRKLAFEINQFRELGIDTLDPATGIYTNPNTGESVSIESLMTRKQLQYLNDRLTAASESSTIAKIAAFTGLKNRDVSSAAERGVVYNDILKQVEDEDNAAIINGTPRQEQINSIFLAWNKYSVEVADTIINSGYLDLPIFAQAKFLQQEQLIGNHQDGYPDFQMQEVAALIQSNYPSLKIPEKFVFEPDFYFFNETADAALGNLISDEQVEEIRTFARAYSSNTVEFASSYFQKEYLKNVDPKFADFLRESIGSSKNGGIKGQISSPDYQPAGTVQSSSLIKKNPVKNDYFTSNQTSFSPVKGTDLLFKGKSYLSDFDSTDDGKSTPVHSITQNTNPEQFISGSSHFGSYTPQEIEAYGIWINPLPGGIITSAPGMRIHPIDKQQHIHNGTDLVLANGNTAEASVIAANGGVITKVEYNHPLNGNRVTIRSVYRSSVYSHTYLHLASIANDVVINKTIPTGHILGICGNTGRSDGTHLHFEVYKNGGPIFIFTDTDKVPDTSIATEPLISLAGQVPVSVGPVLGHTAGESALDKSLASMIASYNRNGGYRMNRAYPTFHMRFVEDDSDETIFQFDDFFSYSAIQEIQVIRDREVAADLAVISITNISGLLSNRKWQGTYLERDPLDINGKKIQENPDNPLATDTSKENPIASFLLQEGTKVELRLGYTNDIDKMDIQIIGKITGIEFNESEDLITIVVQSAATELVQDIKGVDRVEEKDGWFYSDARTADLLTEMISQPECVSFGKWKRGNVIFNTNRNLLTNRWEWNPHPETDNIFAPDSSAMDTAFFEDFFSEMTYYVYRTTVWDIFKEMELRHPDYIASPVPYVEHNGRRTRMTMFFGLPDQLYFASDPSTTGNKKNSEIQETKRQLQEAIDNFDSEQFSILMEKLQDPNITNEIDRKSLDFAKKFLQASGEDWFTRLPGHSKAKQLATATMESFADRLQKKAALDEGAIQPFRKYHLLTTRQHIISNNISASSSNTFNAVTIQYREENNDDETLATTDGLELQDPETFTMKLDARIPDEEVRENLVVYPNCQGDEMAKRYAVSLLTQGSKYMYKGDITILGNPGIKPYDICYVFDEYNDMVGPIEVRRVEHYFSYDQGFITRIIPDLLANASEGTTLTANEALGLMAEAILRRDLNHSTNLLDVSTNPAVGVHTGQSITSNLLYGLSVGAGRVIGFFGAKKLIFINQFGNPVRLTPLRHHGRPMVAGVAPDKLQNVYTINSLAQWIRTGVKGITESSDEFFDRFTYGQNTNILNIRGVRGGGVLPGAFTKP